MKADHSFGMRHRVSWRVYVMVCSLILMIVLMPVINTTDWPILDILFTVVIIAAISVAGESRRSLVIGLCLGIPALVVAWIANVVENNVLAIVNYSLSSFIFLYVFLLMMRKIFKTKTVTLETILLAISCYIMLGLLWVLIYIPIELLAADSISTLAEPGKGKLFAELHYFSYVTLTTLGYGDITPTSPLARSVAILEAITGALFLAILIARLVSAYEVSEMRELEEDEKSEPADDSGELVKE